MISRSFFMVLWFKRRLTKADCFSMRQKFLIIHNKMAGRQNAPLLMRVKEQLDARGIDLTLKTAASLRDDVELAQAAVAASDVDAVIAAGGDSTIRGVAMGLMGTDMPLGIIPAGTGNVLAQEIGLGRHPSKITETLLNGELKTIKPGLANGEPFLLMAGVGFDAEIVKNLDHHLKQRIRKAAYILPSLKALLAKPQFLQVECTDDVGDEKDWDSYRAAFVVVTKVRHYGGRFIIAPNAGLSAQDLQVVMFMNTSRLGLLRSLMGMAMGNNAHVKKQAVHDGKMIGQVMKTSGVMIRSCRHVRITSKNTVPTQIDGEWLGTSPLDINLSDQGVRLIVPTP